MKKLFILFALISFSLSAQYAKSSVSVEGGVSKLENVTKVGLFNAHLDYRFMFNTKFGLKAGVGMTDLFDYKIREASLQGVVNVGRVLEFESFTKKTTLLAFGGVGITDSDYPTNDDIIYRKNHFNPVIGFQIERKLGKRVFAGAGSNLMPGVNSSRSDLGITGTTNKWEFNLALTAPILRGKHYEHADFYIPQPVNDSIFLKPEIHNFYNETINHVKEPSTYYVQFAYDANTFIEGSQAYGIIKSAVEQLEPGQKLYLTAYASPENGTGNPNYNEELAARRGETAKAIAISHGINPNDVEIIVVGSLDTYDGNNIELSRTVKIHTK